MNDFYQSKAAAALDSQLHPMPNEMKEEAKKNFNMICFGCSFLGDDKASFKERGTNGSSAVAFNTVSFNESKYNHFIEMALAHHALGPPTKNDSSDAKRMRGLLKKKHGSLFYNMKEHEVITSTEPDGSTHLLLKKRGKTVVKEEDVFDSIDDVHCDTLGHKKREQTHNEVSRRF